MQTIQLLEIKINEGKNILQDISHMRRTSGPAINVAYQLESKAAIYPRIIIAKELKERIEADLEESILSQTSLAEVPGFSKLFKTDDDGWCYLDYVNPDEIYYELNKEDRLEALERLVQKGLQSPNERVKEKYLWLQKKIEEAKVKDYIDKI